ncbi:tripartite ATP-independent transporter solute receptor, DctP family [Marinobacter gudaonensis]|uniref:Tripartite ATP-independent transporter solute receptor, DctP family n=1 Tax=Marinobacter gudaonensis TaxID=375760 RepID=A0A1I6H287_9GAMM|nr:TRAP transporter substrate-binding protein [Marinobacter gudaonensis]SFR48520.1 tripartite ATP-independent transporter solute receptor, DctP family [Marinobacter gudaonensis]
MKLIPRKSIATALLLCAATVSQAQTTIKLGWTTADSKVDPYAIAAHYFAEELEAAAPGEFNVQFYPNHQLGNDTAMLQAMQFGTMDAGVITGTQVGTLDSAFQLNDLPFLYANNAQAHKVLDGEVGKTLMAKLDSKGIIGLGFPEAGFRHTINNKRPIKTPEDFNGVKLRVQPSDLFIASFRAIGANPVPMAWSDVFTAVQQGTVDGLEIPLPVIYANKYPEVTSYLSLTSHTYNALALLMSKQTFNKLSADTQEKVRQAARRAIDRQRETVAANNGEVLEQIKAAGMTVNEVDDINAFRNKVSGVYDEYRGKIGSDIVDTALKQVSE